MPAAADVLRDAIRQRLLPPGMQLVQSSIAEALGVSRIPVREALQFLASEGLVTFTEDGARVTSLDPDEVYELWTLRALLEPAMAAAIVRNLAPSELARLRGLVEEMERAEGDAWSELNYAFHTELYDVARLPHFAAAARRVLTLIEPYSRVAVNRLEGRAAAQAEHRQLVDALESRDAARLRKVLERHSIRARKLLVDGGGEEPASPSGAAQALAARLLAAGGEDRARG